MHFAHAVKFIVHCIANVYYTGWAKFTDTTYHFCIKSLRLCSK